MNYLTTHTSLSPIWRGFAPGFVNYKKGCTRLAAASDKAYHLLAHGRWFSPGTSASSTTKTGRHDITEIWLKVVLNSKNRSIIYFESDICYRKRRERFVSIKVYPIEEMLHNNLHIHEVENKIQVSKTCI